MKIFILATLISFSVQTSYAAQKKECKGTVQKDGTILYQGDCLKVLEKGDKVKAIDGRNVDSPQKAMELYNEASKHGATSITIEKNQETDKE